MVDAADAAKILTEYFATTTPEGLLADIQRLSPELLEFIVPENAAGPRTLPIAEWLERRLAERAKAEAHAALA